MNESKLPVSIRTGRIIDRKLDVLYPIVERLPNPAVQRKINSDITADTYSMINSQGFPTSEQTGFYEVKTNQRGILSLNQENFSYSGGAHGITVIRSLTFDVITGKAYQLSELFKPDSGYVEKLSELVRQQIEERDIVLLDEFKGIKPEQEYYIADKALVLYYQLYELTAYAFGFPYFPISVYEIADLVIPDGPLGKMIG